MASIEPQLMHKPKSKAHTPHGSTHNIVRGLVIHKDACLVCRMTDANDIKSDPIVFLPGGHIRPGESAQRALKREFKEELGIDCRVGDFIGCFEHSLHSGRYCHDFEIGLLFFVDCPPRLIHADWQPTDQPNIQIGWLSIAELSNQQIKPPGLWQAIQPMLKSSSAHQPFFLSTYPG